ncbi:hypothetical protein HOC01_04785 [archaeon]|nr:hypothetical protein [archaeon]MBT6698283.1 hypothetical protein [archaeon]
MDDPNSENDLFKKNISEKQLTRIVIISAFVGLVLLFFYSGNLELDPISSLDGLREDTAVVIRGKVGRVTQLEKVAFMEVENEKIEETTVVLFTNYDVWLNEGDYVEILGTLEEYEGKMEVIGHNVKVKGKDGE